MDSMCYKERLEEFMLLQKKDILTAAEKERRNTLCTLLNEKCLCETVLDLLDSDYKLTSQILSYLHTSGDSIEQIVFGGVSIGIYLLQKLLPFDGEFTKHFQGFWIEPCDLNEEMTGIVDAAINRALEKMVSDET